MRDEGQSLALLMVDRFSLIAFSALIEPLRIANRLLTKEFYRWKLYSMDGRPVTASNGCSMDVDGSLADLHDADIALICSGIDVERLAVPPELGAILRRFNVQGRMFGAICTGAYILARTNLLAGRKCTIHWENIRSFREEFPYVNVTSDIFAIDRNCITCAGGLAAMDMALRLISIHHGAYMAHEAAEILLYQNMRPADSAQRHDLETRTGISNTKLLEAIRIMDLHIEDPLSCQQLAMTVNLSPRQLERLFRRYFNCTPGQYYLKLRLETARDLLRRTNRSVLNVAIACGFASTSHFTKCFREKYGCTPTSERQAYYFNYNIGDPSLQYDPRHSKETAC